MQDSCQFQAERRAIAATIRPDTMKSQPPGPAHRVGTSFEAQVFQAFPHLPAFGNMRRVHSFSRKNFASGLRTPPFVQPKINSYAQ